MPITSGELRKIRLQDGRHLAFREYGDPSGNPVLCHHGLLMSGLDVETADKVALRKGIRLIAPNRPGVGDSSLKHGRTVSDWSHDVQELITSLQIRTFGVFGWGAGCAYALATAALLPDLVSSAVLVAPIMPLQDHKNLGRLLPSDQVMFELARERPQRARKNLRMMRWLARFMPRSFLHIALKDLCPADEAVIFQLTTKRYAQWYREAVRHSEGVVDDYRALLRPWGFSFSQVAAPTSVFHGRADTVMPSDWSIAVAESVQHGNYISEPNGGHYFAQVHWSQVLEPLAQHDLPPEELGEATG